MEMLARALVRCLVYIDRATIYLDDFIDEEDDSTLLQGAQDALDEARFLIGQASPAEKETLIRVLEELRAEETMTRGRREVLHCYRMLLEDLGLEPAEDEDEPEDE
jgi:hypothetical protein